MSQTTTQLQTALERIAQMKARVALARQQREEAEKRAERRSQLIGAVAASLQEALTPLAGLPVRNPIDPTRPKVIRIDIVVGGVVVSGSGYFTIASFTVRCDEAGERGWVEHDDHVITEATALEIATDLAAKALDLSEKALDALDDDGIPF